MDIGINYITELDMPQNRYDEIYKMLIKKGYINTLKFPGKYCNYNSLEHFLQIATDTGVKMDIHGLPGMVPAIHSKNFTKNIEWEKIIPKLKNCKKISTHMGLENKDIMANYVEGTLETNYKEIKEKLNCEIGVENIPSGFEFDKKTLTPEFITETWKKVDFGVFDISHAKLAARELDMTYQEYLEKIGNKEKVKILHVSGNITEIGSRKNERDKHVLINYQEIKDIIQLFDQFTNTKLIISEYAYNSKYTYEKELIIEAIVLNTIVKTLNVKTAQKILEYLEQNLNDDISNIEELMKGRVI